MNESDILKKISETKILVVYFSQPTCTVCKSLRPKIEMTVRSYTGIGFQYVDTTLFPNLSGQNMIFTVPTIVLFYQGREVKRWSRYFSIDEFIVELDRYKIRING
jgi:thioredoxin-like negative regulator of GroEL